MTKKGLTVVGWYHSHPTSEPKPTESDILSQKAYQDALRRRSGDEPCIAVITSMSVYVLMCITYGCIYNTFYWVKGCQ